MIDLLFIVILVVLIILCFGALYLNDKIEKLEEHIDNLYENDEIIMREVQFQDEWIELDIDLGDED